MNEWPSSETLAGAMNTTNQAQANQRAMPGYGQAAAQKVSAPRPRRRLDDIGAAADATARISERLDELIVRFQSGTSLDSGGSAPNAIAVSYTSHLDRLQDNIGRIQKALDQLEELA